jgi:hypothetical protein
MIAGNQIPVSSGQSFKTLHVNLQILGQVNGHVIAGNPGRSYAAHDIGKQSFP